MGKGARLALCGAWGPAPQVSEAGATCQGAGGQHRRGQLAPRGPSCLSQGGRRAAFHSKEAAWGPPAPDPRALAVGIQVARARRQPRGDSRGSLGSSASCPGRSAGSVAPAPSQFSEQTEVSTTGLREPAQSAVGMPRTCGEGLCIWGCGRLHIRASAGRATAPGLVRAEDRSVGMARDSRVAAGGQEIAPQRWKGAPVCVSPSCTVDREAPRPGASPWSSAGTRCFCLLPTKPKSGANQRLTCGGLRPGAVHGARASHPRGLAPRASPHARVRDRHT